MKLSDFPNRQTSACEWPEAWLMPEQEVQPKDLKLPNHMSPNFPVSVEDLRDLGISYSKIGVDAFASPVVDADWDSSDDEAEEMRSIKSKSAQHRFSYANIITLDAEKHFPEYSAREVQAAFERNCLHHSKRKVCYVLVGSGFLDVRCSPDRWVRLRVKKGDQVTVPEDLYHRFTSDERGEDGDVKFFAGQAFWTPLVRIMLDGRIASN